MNVETTEAYIVELKDLLITVNTYIGKVGSILFDEESAIQQNELEDVIAVGQTYNEMVLADAQGDSEYNSRIKRVILRGLTHYGNWCMKRSIMVSLLLISWMLSIKNMIDAMR